MNYTPVESSQIAQVGYEPETQTLGIKFHPTRKQKDAGLPGSEYHYSGVSQQLHEGLVGAVSVGKFFGEHIKNDPLSFPYRKIEPELPGVKGAIADFMDAHGIDTIKAGSTIIKRS